MPLRRRIARGMGQIGPALRVARPSPCAMLLGERDDGRSNPVAIGMYNDGVAINFDFVRDKRTSALMHRFVELMRSTPGLAGYIHALEEHNWGCIAP